MGTAKKTHLAFGGLHGVRCRTSGKYGGLKVSTYIKDVDCKRCIEYRKADNRFSNTTVNINVDVSSARQGVNNAIVAMDELRKALGLPKAPEVCGSCGNAIRTQIFKGTGVCSVDCMKALSPE